MFAQIIPKIKLKRSLKTFDYEIPESLEKEVSVGSLVTIEFRQKEIVGVVANITTEPTIKNRAINFIKKTLPQKLTKNELNFILWFSNYYFISPGLALELFMPDEPKKKMAIKWPDWLNTSEQNFKLAPGQIKEVKEVLQRVVGAHGSVPESEGGRPSTPTVIIPTLEQYLLLYTGIIKNTNNQIILIIPEINRFQTIARFLHKKFPNDISLFYAEQNKTQNWSNWNDFHSGKTKVAIGTRMAILAQAKNLQTIIIDQEENESHKQWDQNPRYSVRRVAEFLQSQTNCQIISTATSPRPETYYQAQKDRALFVVGAGLAPTQTTIANFQDEWQRQNYSSITWPLEEQIKNNLRQNKTSVLFLNRFGAGSSIICADCNYLFTCPECKKPFTQKPDGSLYCYACKKEATLPEYCPHCQSIKLKTLGFGLDKTKKEVLKLWPDAKILLFQAEDKIPDDLEKYQIIITTTAFIPYLSQIKNLGTVGLINVDLALASADWQSQWRVYEFVNQLQHQLKNNQSLIIQTFNPQNPALQALDPSRQQSFYQLELKNREKYHYPPFGQIIKLIYQDVNNQKAKLESERLHNELKKYFTDLSDPTPISSVKIRGRFRWQLIIKTKIISNELLALLHQKVPEDWLVDCDPENIS